MYDIGIVGLGYVGAPLAAAMAEAGHSVTGYDIDDGTVDRLRTRQPVLAGTDGRGAADRSEPGPEYSTDSASLEGCDIIITTVPTPVTAALKPDLSNVRAAARTVGEQLSPGSIAVLESTVYPGATREEFVPEIERASGLALGVDFDIGYSPERLSPGSDCTLRNSVKPVGANTDEVQSVLVDLYDDIVEDVHPAPSIEATEAAKCIENTQRDVNIALVNELAMACDQIDQLDYEEVLSVAESKWNFHRYDPGLVEGHCIPVDPYYLIDRFEREGASASLVRQARAVNESVVDHVLGMTGAAFAERRERIARDESAGDRAQSADDRLLALGLSYKPDAADVRSMAKRRLFDRLRDDGLDVVGYDPNVDPDDAAAMFDIGVCDSLEEVRTDSDDGDIAGALVLTEHAEFFDLDLDDMAEILPSYPVVVDLPRVFEEPDNDALVYRRL